VRAALANGPVELDAVASGAAVLARIESAPDSVVLVVLEALLDDMSGLAFCRRLREAERRTAPRRSCCW
jgi:CheY-like chemotaxis protein